MEGQAVCEEVKRMERNGHRIEREKGGKSNKHLDSLPGFQNPAAPAQVFP